MEEHNEECNHEHDNSHRNGKELHTLIEIQQDRDKEYHVVFAYFVDDVGKQLVGGPLGFGEMSDEVLVHTYSVMAPDMASAMSKARDIDFARKMEQITNFVNIVADGVNKYDDAPPFEPKMIEDFRQFMIREKNFVKVFLAEPTTVTAVLASNRGLAEQHNESNVLRDKLNIGDDVESWLKENDDKENSAD